MYGKEAGDVISDRECYLCQRVVNDGRADIWCFDCFRTWYDGDLPPPDSLNPLKVANHVRSKHGLPPLTVEQLHPSLLKAKAKA